MNPSQNLLPVGVPAGSASYLSGKESFSLSLQAFRIFMSYLFACEWGGAVIMSYLFACGGGAVIISSSLTSLRFSFSFMRKLYFSQD